MQGTRTVYRPVRTPFLWAGDQNRAFASHPAPLGDQQPARRRTHPTRPPGALVRQDIDVGKPCEIKPGPGWQEFETGLGEFSAPFAR